MDNTMIDRYGRHDLSEVATMPPTRNVEFPPLSQQPVGEGCSMPPSNPVDQLVLEKCTPTPPVEKDNKQEETEEVEAKCEHVVPQTEELIAYGVKQAKHALAMILELKLLLTHEVTVLQQVLTRIDKFKNLRDCNKCKTTQWEQLYKSVIPDYDSWSIKLVNVPQSQVLNVEGWPAPVQQKILFQLVSRTTNTANRVLVQLSMEETVANDIDLTLGDLKKHCIVMIRQINGWLKNLKTQECLHNVILERWNNIKLILKEVCNKGREGGESTTSTNVNLKAYEERLKKIEHAICCLMGPAYGTCKTNPPKPPCPQVDGFTDTGPNKTRQGATDSDDKDSPCIPWLPSQNTGCPGGGGRPNTYPPPGNVSPPPGSGRETISWFNCDPTRRFTAPNHTPPGLHQQHMKTLNSSDRDWLQIQASSPSNSSYDRTNPQLAYVLTVLDSCTNMSDIANSSSPTQDTNLHYRRVRRSVSNTKPPGLTRGRSNPPPNIFPFPREVPRIPGLPGNIRPPRPQPRPQYNALGTACELLPFCGMVFGRK